MGGQVNKKYDFAVVGAGHNGLVFAGYCARAGLKGIVLEAAPHIGGACVSSTMTVEVDGEQQDCTVSEASYVASLISEDVLRDLEAKEHGYVVYERDPPSHTPTKNGKHLILHTDRAKTQAAIAEFSKKDAAMFPIYEETLDRIARFIEPMLGKIPPDLFRTMDLGKLASMGLDVKALGKEDFAVLLKLFTWSAYDFVCDWFESEPLRATLCTDGIIGTMGGPKTPGTAYVLIHHAMGGVNGHRGRWGYVRGGMGGFTNALASYCLSKGVVIRTNADVQRNIIENGRIRGVELVGGEVIQARIVGWSADPQQTFERATPPEHQPPKRLARLKKINYESGTSKMNGVLSGPLVLYNYDGPTPQGTIHFGADDCEYMERAYDDAKYGRISDNLILEACIPSTVDGSLVPKGSGLHVLSVLIQYTPYTLANGVWDDAMRAHLQAKVINKMAEYCNIKDVLLKSETLTPLDLERKFRLTGGNLFHGSMIPTQLFSQRPDFDCAQYAVPGIKGMYLCGSGAHPGGGVTGYPGRNAAKVALGWRW